MLRELNITTYVTENTTEWKNQKNLKNTTKRKICIV